MRIKTKTIFTILLLLVFVFGFHKLTKAYDNKITHPQLAGLAVKLYNQKHPDKEITDQELKWIKQGAKEEDEPAIRCLNHFYNPITKKPISLGSNTAIEWSHNSTRQSIPTMGGDFSWEHAKYYYADNKQKMAFQSLGHILHLIEDMAVPAHTRSDSHLKGDPFEEWAAKNGKNITADSIVQCQTLDICMQEMAKFSNNNFLSKDSINENEIKKKNLKAVSKYYDGKFQDYLSGNIDNQNYLVVQADDYLYAVKYSLNPLVHSDYWRILSPKAVSYSARIIELFFKEADEQAVQRKPKTIINRIKYPFVMMANLAIRAKTATENAAAASLNAVSNAVKNTASAVFRKLLSHNQKEVLNELLPKKAQAKENNKTITNGSSIFYNGAFTSQSKDITLKPREETELWAKIKNTGLSDWKTNQVFLNITTAKTDNIRKESPFYHQSWITKLRPAGIAENISIGDIGTIKFKIKSPDTEGIYQFSLKPVYQENTKFHWLGKDKAVWNIIVSDLKEAKRASFMDIPKKFLQSWTTKIKKAASIISPIIKEEEKAKENKKAEEEIKEPTIKKPKPASLPSPHYGFFAPPPITQEENKQEQISKLDEGKNTENEDGNQEQEPTLGCTDETAINYNQDATEDDGSCIYPEPEPEPELEPEPPPESEPTPYPQWSVVINEIAWAGTVSSSDDEWIELYNTTETPINLSGWKLADEESQLNISFENANNRIIESRSYYLIERSNDDTIKDIAADLTAPFNGGLKNEGENLILFDPSDFKVDEVNAKTEWFAGDKDKKISMERINPLADGSGPANWISNDTIHINGIDSKDNPIKGTPKKQNSSAYPEPEPTPEPNNPFIAQSLDFNIRDLKTTIYNNKIYYAWLKAVHAGYSYCYQSAIGYSNLDGTDFKYQIIGDEQNCETNKYDLNFVIYNNKAYLAWFMQTNWGQYSQPLYDLFIQQADLSMIDNKENKNNFKTLQITDNFMQTAGNIDMKIINKTIRVSWSGNKNEYAANLSNNKIAILDIDTDDFENIPEIKILSSTNGKQYNIQSKIYNNKQYYLWACSSINSAYCYPGSFGWGIYNLENENWTDYFDGGNISSSRAIAMIGEAPYIFWNNTNSRETIQYSPIDVFFPSILINEESRISIIDAKQNNNKTYLLYTQIDQEESANGHSYTRQMKLIDVETKNNIFAYRQAKDENGEYINSVLSIHSRILFDLSGNIIIVWAEAKKKGGMEIYIWRERDCG